MERDPSNPGLTVLTPWDRARLFARGSSTARTIALVVLALLVMGLSLHCYGDGREKQGAALARSAVTDSVATVLHQTAQRIADSALALVTRANARADSAILRQQHAEQTAYIAQTEAAAALARSRNITPQVIATLPPEVRTVLVDLQSSNVKLAGQLTEMAGVATGLRTSLDDERAISAKWHAAYVSADSAATTYHREVIELRAVKTTRFGFQAGLIAGAGLVLAAVVGVVTLHH